ncbi:MAG: glycosyltransferase family 2 protein [Flavobacteriaceae bacterium]|jgi:glycosyltransferase involved in cell wall biosynthesis|nr:glycosyltransferase family 2 protein [Flavobacteriaceae bacterium]
MPKFSVIIPLFNKEEFIKDSLSSVLIQSFQDFEIIIINDCSTDLSLSIAKQFTDKRIKIVEHSKNKGLSASRNTGIKIAKSDYIAFLDADDLWKPGFLEKIKFLIESYPQASLFATKYDILLKNNKILEHQFQIKGFTKHGIIPNFFENNLNQSIFYPSCLCVSRNVFDAIGLYNESINYSEDVDFNIRSQANFKFAYSDEALVTYLRVSENQITQSGLDGKNIPDYDFYEEKFIGRNDIKKYLDFQRYTKGKQYKLSGNKKNYSKLIAKIDNKNLTTKQIILLKSPRMLLQLLSNFKILLQKMGFEVNSY